MKRAMPYKAVTFFLLLVAGGIAAVTACSNQGEGERCEVLNGNDDCKTDEDLVCYPAAQLTNTDSDRCCPVVRENATHPVCKTPRDIIADATAPSDTGPPPATPDAGTDADAGADADIADAPADG